MTSILLIEHNRDIRYLVSINMTVRGYEVVEAGTFNEAIELLAQQIKPQFIILDLLPPNKHGLEFLDMLNQHPRYGTIPVLVITVMISKEIGSQLDPYPNILGVIEKPFNITTLLAHVKGLAVEA